MRLLKSADKSVSQIAVELGVRRNQLYRWREELAEKGSATFSNQRGRKAKEDESDVVRFLRELAEVTEERDILEKAAQYFARELKWSTLSLSRIVTNMLRRKCVRYCA